MENKIVFGILTILFNAFGVPCFLQGKTKQGIIVIVLTVVTFGVMAFVNEIMGLIKGIQILLMSDEDFAKQAKDLKVSIPG